MDIYLEDLAAAKRARRAWGCTCGADNPNHYDACHACQRPSWTCAACGTVNTCGRGECNECGNTMPAELLGDRSEGFEMTHEEWVKHAHRPAQGGRPLRPRGRREHMTVRYDRDDRETTHCSGWDADKALFSYSYGQVGSNGK